MFHLLSLDLNKNTILRKNSQSTYNNAKLSTNCVKTTECILYTGKRLKSIITYYRNNPNNFSSGQTWYIKFLVIVYNSFPTPSQLTLKKKNKNKNKMRVA